MDSNAYTPAHNLLSVRPQDTVMDMPGTPERIYNLMFVSGLFKDSMRENPKLENKFYFFFSLSVSHECVQISISDCPYPLTRTASRAGFTVRSLPGPDVYAHLVTSSHLTRSRPAQPLLTISPMPAWFKAYKLKRGQGFSML
jgi:hypothetical protein